MDKERSGAGRIYREFGVPDVDSKRNGHRMGGVQCGNRYMAHLQKPRLSKMQYDRRGAYGDIIPTRQRSDSG
eukprot:7440558-Heterocapsa_arctica.AAC.1